MSIIIPGPLDRIQRHGPGNGLAIGLGVDAHKRTCSRFSLGLSSQTRTSQFTQYVADNILIGIYILLYKKEKKIIARRIVKFRRPRPPHPSPLRPTPPSPPPSPLPLPAPFLPLPLLHSPAPPPPRRPILRRRR